jgi:hypothetical protein
MTGDVCCYQTVIYVCRQNSWSGYVHGKFHLAKHIHILIHITDQRYLTILYQKHIVLRALEFKQTVSALQYRNGYDWGFTVFNVYIGPDGSQVCHTYIPYS